MATMPTITTMVRYNNETDFLVFTLDDIADNDLLFESQKEERAKARERAERRAMVKARGERKAKSQATTAMMIATTLRAKAAILL